MADEPLTDYFSGTVQAMYLLVCWVGFYFGFRYYESMQSAARSALRASALAQEAQLKMLRYQFNPHFLFNTLNAISTLILDNRNSTANSAVTGLSEFLRLHARPGSDEEGHDRAGTRALNLYLNIEKMRFGERLIVEFAIDDAASSVLMPSLLLQPLIENAIKYAVSPREEGGRFAFAAHVDRRHAAARSFRTTVRAWSIRAPRPMAVASVSAIHASACRCSTAITAQRGNTSRLQ